MVLDPFFLLVQDRVGAGTLDIAVQCQKIVAKRCFSRIGLAIFIRQQLGRHNNGKSLGLPKHYNKQMTLARIRDVSIGSRGLLHCTTVSINPKDPRGLQQQMTS
jgi:hypothetical protein